MNNEILEDLKAKVTKAEELQRQIKALDEAIGSCNAEVGFMNIIVNFKNQNEVNLNTSFPAKQIFDNFKINVIDAALGLKAKLEAEFKNLK